MRRIINTFHNPQFHPNPDDQVSPPSPEQGPPSRRHRDRARRGMIGLPPAINSQRGNVRNDSPSRTNANALSRYRQQLLEWKLAAPFGEIDGRRQATRLIEHAISRNLQNPSQDGAAEGTTGLALRGLGLTTLPPLPATLTTLDVSDNQLATLPELPATLRALQASRNRLTTLPILPANLTSLSVSCNQLTSLPRLPSTMKSLYAPLNLLTGLPNLPATLETINVACNRLSALPDLPATLKILDVEGNQLTAMPELPATLTTVHASDNPLTTVRIETSGPENPREQREQELRNAGDAAVPHPSRRPRGKAGWVLLADQGDDYTQPGAAVFGQFLRRLGGVNGHPPPAEYCNPLSRADFVARVDALLDGMEASPDLRLLCLNIAQESTTACSDRVTLTLNDMELAHIGDNARRGRYREEELFELGRGMYRLGELERIVTSTVAAEEAHWSTVDQVEIRLAYQTRLASRLNLPGMSRSMWHESAANLSRGDFDKAVNAVRREEAATGGIDFLAKWEPWQEAMKRRNPASFARVEQSILEQQEAFAVLPSGLSSQVQQSLYAGVVARTKREIENFTTTETVKFLSENPHVLPGR